MLILVCWTGYLSLRLGANWVLGKILKEVFQSGTGCEVQLSSPFLELFPLRGSVERVSIRHASELPQEGFTADHVEIGLEFLPLFHGEVRLHGLLIRGARATSLGPDTGFLNTMSFLFPPDAPISSAPPGFFGRQFQKLVVHLTDIRIPGIGTEERQLVLGQRDDYFQAKNVDLVFIERDGDAKKPYDMIASVDEGEFIHETLRPSAFGKVTLSGALGLGMLIIDEAHLQSRIDPDSRVKISGEMGINLRGSYALEVEGDLSERALDEMFPPSDIGHPERIRLKTSVRGKLDHPELVGSFALHPGSRFFPSITQECKPELLSSDFRYSPEEISLNGVHAARIIENGVLRYGFEDKKVTLDFPITLAGASIFRDCAQSYKQGTGEFVKVLQQSSGRVRIEGTTEPRNLLATISLDVASESTSHLVSQFQVEEKNIVANITEEIRKNSKGGTERLNLHARYSLDEKIVDVDKFSAKDFPVETLFRMALPFLSREDGERWTEFVDSRTLLQTQSTFRLDAKNNQFVGKGNLVLVTVPLPGGSVVPRLSIPFQADNKNIALEIESILFSGGGSLGGKLVYGLKEGNLQLTLLSSALNLKQFGESFTKVPQQAQFLSASLDLQGPVKDAKLKLNAQLSNAQKQPILNILGGGTTRSPEFRISDVSGGLEISLRLANLLSGKPQLSLDGDLKQVRLEKYLSGVSDVKGKIGGRIHYESALDRPLSGRGSIDIPEFGIGKGDLQITQAQPIRMILENGKLDFTQVQLRFGDKLFSITGNINQQQGWQLDLDGKWNLAALPHPEDIFLQLNGDLGLKVRLRGALSQPEIFGVVQIADASFVVPVGIDALTFRKVQLQGEFEKDSFTLDNLQAVTPGGAVSVRGKVLRVFEPEMRSLDFQANLKRIRVQPVENLQLALSGDLKLTEVPTALPRISGSLHIDRASYEKTIDLFQIVQQLTSFITGKQRRSVATGDAKSRDASASLDVAIVAENDLVIETNIVRAELSSNLKLSGDTAVPLLDGNIQVLEGEFGSRSNTFVITSGKASFLASQGTLDPALSLVAETSVLSTAGQEQFVRMFLSGSLTKPKIDFASESGLRQEEIIGLLGLRTNLQTVRLLGKDKEQRSFADLINPVSGATLQDRISGITGFSEVQVDTAISGATGEVVPRLVAKRPLVGRLSLDAVSELSGQQLSILNLSYPLTTFVNAIAGFRTIPPNGAQANGSGSLYIGLRHRSTFPGTTFIPRDLTTSQIPSRTGVNDNFGLPRQ